MRKILISSSIQVSGPALDQTVVPSFQLAPHSISRVTRPFRSLAQSVGFATVLSRLLPPEVASARFSDTGQQVSRG